mmetsp:Transcript_80136/g.203891  ORF Transcript_80136/g.203891 Transcript_80136/m.203891 type:complete len:375 (-) Transcript_80136:975-2099(-)
MCLSAQVLDFVEEPLCFLSRLQALVSVAAGVENLGQRVQRHGEHRAAGRLARDLDRLLRISQRGCLQAHHGLRTLSVLIWILALDIKLFQLNVGDDSQNVRFPRLVPGPLEENVCLMRRPEGRVQLLQLQVRQSHHVQRVSQHSVGVAGFPQRGLRLLQGGEARLGLQLLQARQVHVGHAHESSSLSLPVTDLLCRQQCLIHQFVRRLALAQRLLRIALGEHGHGLRGAHAGAAEELSGPRCELQGLPVVAPLMVHDAQPVGDTGFAPHVHEGAEQCRGRLPTLKSLIVLLAEDLQRRHVVQHARLPPGVPQFPAQQQGGLRGEHGVGQLALGHMDLQQRVSEQGGLPSLVAGRAEGLQPLLRRHQRRRQLPPR